jgi:hypothetical protein
MVVNESLSSQQLSYFTNTCKKMHNGTKAALQRSVRFSLTCKWLSQAFSCDLDQNVIRNVDRVATLVVTSSSKTERLYSNKELVSNFSVTYNPKIQTKSNTIQATESNVTLEIKG